MEDGDVEILLFGAGSLGSLLGGLLAREHDVTLVGRDPHVRAIRESGLRVEGEREFVVHPEARTEAAGSFDLAVVTVKAFDTPEAATALAGCDLGGALSVQNGMGNEEILEEALGCPILAGTTTFGARRREPGVVECTGVGEVALGPQGDAHPDGAPHELADRVGGAFGDAGIETEVVGDMRPRLWRKLAINAGINPVTALARVENGALCDGPARTLARRAAVEVAGVARERGIDLADGEARDAVLAVAEATATNVSSMRADVEAGRRTEIDAITGYVVESAARGVPVNETLLALVRAWEGDRGLR